MCTADRTGQIPSISGPVPRALARPDKQGEYQPAGWLYTPRAFFLSLVGAAEGDMKCSPVPCRSHFWILDLFTEEPCSCFLSDIGNGFTTFGKYME